MSLQVDKKVCLEILDRGLRPVYTGWINFLEPELRDRVIFRGPAKLYDQFNNPEFKQFMEKYGIASETKIAVAKMENPGDFAVIKV